MPLQILILFLCLEPIAPWSPGPDGDPTMTDSLNVKTASQQTRNVDALLVLMQIGSMSRVCWVGNGAAQALLQH